MLRKSLPWFLVALLALLTAVVLLRPVTISDGRSTVRAPAGALSVGQALQSAGLSLRAGDQVQPAPDQLIPVDGQIRVQRAAAITLWEDGNVRLVTGLGGTVAEVLRAGGVTIGPGDRLWWNGRAIDSSTPIPAGAAWTIQLQRARVVLIETDSKRLQVETTANTAAGALWSAGIRLGPGDDLSAAPDAPLEAPPGGGPVTLGYRPAREVRVETGGQVITTRTTARTIGEALAHAGVALHGLDYTLPPESAPLPAGGAVRVVRVREEVALREELLPFSNERVPDPETEFDATRVLQEGRYGVNVTRERARFEDGQETARGVDSDWTASDPVAQRVGVGTKVVTKTLDIGGEQIEYWRAVNVYATSYSPCQQGIAGCSYGTASGMRLRKGVIAVTGAWYRQIGGLPVYVPGYGRGVIGDVGGGIPGTPWIDLGFDESDFQPIVGWTTMYLLTPAPANPNLVLP